MALARNDSKGMAMTALDKDWSLASHPVVSSRASSKKLLGKVQT